MIAVARSSGAVLIVEHCDAHRHSLVRYLSRYFECVEGVQTIPDAMSRISQLMLVCAVLDLEMPDGSAIDLVPVLRNANPKIKIVVVTGHGSIAAAIDAVRRGVDDYLTKPASLEQILAACSRRSSMRSLQPRPFSLERVKWEHIQRVLAESQ